MRIKNLELWAAFLVIALVTIFYVQTVTASTVPSASGLLGHTLGVIGFVLMLMTEVLYSLRKRYQFARWGKLQHWLSFHIFTGLVGPYLVLLHTSWKFNGLAGVLMLLTVLIVASGFVGRYFYTAVPRSADGTALEVEETVFQIQEAKQGLNNWLTDHPDLASFINKADPQSKPSWLPWQKSNLQRDQKHVPDNISSETIKEYSRLVKHHDILNRQLNNMDRSRRLLAIWHTLHVPLGMMLFFIAFIHILATLYFATLLH